MDEPNKSIELVDETVGISKPAPRPSLNIGTIVISDTGTTERVTLNNYSDLVENYCVGSDISQRDDQSIKLIAGLLGIATADVIRVDTCDLRVGMGSLGTTIYGDKKFNVIPKLTKVNIDKQIKHEFEVIYMEVTSMSGTGSSAKTLYYLGNKDKIPPEDSQDIIVSGKSLATSISENLTGKVTLKEFFERMKYRGYSIYNDSQIMRIPGKITMAKDNIFKSAQITELKGNLVSITGEDFDVYPGDRLRIGNHDFVNATGNVVDLSNGNYVNPIPIVDNSLPQNNYIKGSTFLNKILDYIISSDSLPDPIAIDMDYVLTVKTGDGLNNDSPQIDESISKYFKIDASDSANLKSKIIVNNGFTELLDNVAITIKDTTYYVGKVPSYGQLNKVKLSDVPACTPQNFLQLLYEELKTKSQSSGLNPECDALTNKIYYLSASAPVISFQTVADKEGITINKPDNTEISEFKHLTDEENKNQFTTNLWLRIDNSVYYTGEEVPDSKYFPGLSPNFIRLSKLQLNIDEFFDKLYNQLKLDYLFNPTETGFILAGDHSVVVCPELISPEVVKINQTGYKDKFILFGKFSSTKDLFQYSYKKNDDEYNTYSMQLKYKTGVKNYSISFDPDAMNSFGKSIYYTQINEGDSSSPNFYITTYGESEKEGTFKEFKSNTYGGLTLLKPTDADIVKAISKFAKYKDKNYHFIWDSGIPNLSLKKECSKLTIAKHAIYAMSFPEGMRDVEDFINFRNATNIDNPRVIFLAGSYKAVVAGNWLTELPMSLIYMGARISAFNTVASEFIPLFGPNKAQVSVSNMTCRFDEEERQKLLDNQIISIISDFNGTYINFNLTGAKKESYLSEDQNIYMSNCLCHVCDQYADTLQAEVSDPALWSRIVSDLNSRINSRMITSKSPKLAGYKVLCDADMNKELREQRTVKFEVLVQYSPTTAYVRGYVKIQRLGSF